MLRRLLFLAIFAIAAACAVPPVSAHPPAGSADSLDGVRSKLVQLRSELQMNSAAQARPGLSADSMERLNARAQQISNEINALVAQERNLSQK